MNKNLTLMDLLPAPPPSPPLPRFLLESKGESHESNPASEEMIKKSGEFLKATEGLSAMMDMVFKGAETAHSFTQLIRMPMKILTEMGGK